MGHDDEHNKGPTTAEATSSLAPESLFTPLEKKSNNINNSNHHESTSLHDPLLPPSPTLEQDVQQQQQSDDRHCQQSNATDPTDSSASRLFLYLLAWTRRLLTPTDDTRRYLRQLIRRMGNYLAYFTLLLMLIVIPQVIYRGVKNDNIDFAAYNSAGVMVLGTIVLSFRLVYLHLTHWYMPEVQKYVVRILWMVPLYAVQSWLSLRFHSSRIYIDTVRDLYEAYVIASFVYYLIELLGGEEGLIHILESKQSPSLGYHTFPLRLILEPWELGEDFMLQCKHGVLQYVVFKIVAAALTLLFEALGVYGEGQFHWMVAYPYLVVFQNVSVCYALYCLVMLYSAVDEELRHPINWRPLGKFLCVKGVVFFCWWQGLLIFYLSAHGFISGAGSRWSREDVAYGLIDYCIVFEMVLFAIAHSYTFTYQEYLPSNLPPEYLEQQDGTISVTFNTTSQTLPGRQYTVPTGGEVDDHSAPTRDGDSTTGVPRTTLQSAVSDFTAATHTTTSSTRTYRPPALLDRPMDFRDALWSSTLPKETIEDIQRLRVGREFVVALRPRTSSQESATRRSPAAASSAGTRDEENPNTPPSTPDAEDSSSPSSPDTEDSPSADPGAE